jgi:tubulin polyglutamylase complex subunit 2
MSQIRELFDQLSINLINFLESHEGISSVKLVANEPIVNRSKLDEWLNSNDKTNFRKDVSLPEDYKVFLNCCNGLTLTYDLKKLPFGYLHINSLQEMSPISKESMDELQAVVPNALYAFDIDSQANNGRVALIYKSNNNNENYNNKSKLKQSSNDLVTNSMKKENQNLNIDLKNEIWFQDLSMQWFFITHSFTQYFRLCLLHLGIPHWQYAFTTIGLPAQSRMWFAFLSPERFEIDKHGKRDALEERDSSIIALYKKKNKKLDLNKINQVLKKQKTSEPNESGNRYSTGRLVSNFISQRTASASSIKRPAFK